MGRALDLLSAMFCSPKQLQKTKPQQAPLSIVPEGLRQYLPFALGPTDSVIILKLRKEDIAEMDKLVRYFEAPYDGLLVRGIKLMHLIKSLDAEEGKRLCVVNFDQESGEVLGMQNVVIS